MAHFEIEVKSLLGELDKAESLRDRMLELDPDCTCVSQNKQLNHYFTGGKIVDLFEKTKHLFSDDQKDKFKILVKKGSVFSVRTRQRNDEILLVAKASIDEGSSENTVKRLEFEESVQITLDELDKLVLSADFTYQAKWSRERDEYAYKGANVCIDKNAGYGYLAEFEKIVANESEVDKVRDEIDVLMLELGMVELGQDRLARMFAHYNDNWGDYYGTDKTFIIE